jgi:hypothetical protein
MFAVSIAITVLVPSTALAYIDPISGSVFFQAIVAGLLGAVLTVKGVGSTLKGTARRIWRRLKG